MTEPTTEELVERLTGMKGPNYIPTWVIILMAQAAQRLSDLEGKLGEARMALEPFAGWQADCPRCVASKFTCDAHYRASEALKLTASGGGGDNSLSSAAEHSIAFGSVETAAQHSAGGGEP